MKLFKILSITVLITIMFAACNPVTVVTPSQDDTQQTTDDTQSDENPTDDTPAEEEVPAPNDISNLKALNQGAAILLTWVEDFYEQNIYGIEISYKTDSSGRNIYTVPLSNNTVIVPQNQRYCLINNLTNNIPYIFTVKAINTDGKKSLGISVTATPEPFPLKIELSVPEEPSRNQTTITATITSSSEINKIVSKKGEIIDPTTLLDDENLSTYSHTEDNTYSLTVYENGIYTFAASDITGRQTAVSINVQKIDNTPPAEVSDISYQYNKSQNTLVLSWKDPEDSTEEYNSPYDHVLIFYNLESTSDCYNEDANYKSITVPKGQETVTINDIDNIKKSWDLIVFKTLDKAGNISDGTDIFCNTYLYSATKDTAVDLINYLADSDIENAAINITGEITPEFITELTNAIKLNNLELFLLNLEDTTGESGFDQDTEGYKFSNFNGNCKIRELILPSGLQRIGNNVFSEAAFSILTIPNTVTEIGDSAFSGCKNLKNLVIPDSVTEIGDYAFFNCNGYYRYIPDSVISIGDYAFEYCGTINHLPQNIEVINSGTFKLCGFPNGELVLPDSIKRIEGGAFWQSYASSVKLPNSLNFIGNKAFYGMDNLKQIILPDTIKTYYKGHFENGTPIYDDEIISGLSCTNYKNNARIIKSILDDFINVCFIYTDEVDKNIDISSPYYY